MQAFFRLGNLRFRVPSFKLVVGTPVIWLKIRVLDLDSLANRDDPRILRLDSIVVTMLPMGERVFQSMLQILDYLFDLLHIGVILINLFGWVHPHTRWLQFAVIHLTAVSWLGLGAFYGLGYCVLTDWHWQIKQQLGAGSLPSSYITYLLQGLGIDISRNVTDWLTGLCFGAALLMSWLFLWRKRLQSRGG